MLSVWDPFEQLSRLEDQLFGKTVANNRAALRVPVDIIEEDKAFVIKAELPEMKAEDVNIEVDKNTLTLSGTRLISNQVEKENYRRIEREYGSFTRSFSLPEHVDPEQITAEMKDGVLTLRLPKGEKKSAKRIKVNN